MEYSEVEMQAVESAAQLIAGIDKPDNAVKPPRLKTVSAFDMTAPGAWRARRDLYRSLCHTPKDRISFEAADLYEDILDLWQQRDRVQNFSKRHNCFYWGRPIAKWAKKYKCTERQFDYWLKVLRDCKLIATCMMKTKTNMLQIRPLVAEGSAYLSGWPDSQNFKHLLKPKTQAQQGQAEGFCPAALEQNLSQCISTNFVPLKNLGLHVGVACTGLKDFVDASLSTEASTSNSKTDSGKTDPENQTPVLLESILKFPKFCTASTRNSAGLLWESLVVQYQPEHHAPLAVRAFRDLRTAFEKIDSMADLPGHEPVLRWGIRNWVFWARPIGYEQQVNPKAVVTRLDTLLAAYREERECELKKAADKAEMAAAIKKANAEILAAQAAKASAPPPVKKLSSIAQAVAQFKAGKALVEQAATPPAEPCPCAGTPEAHEPVVEAVAAPAPVQCPAVVLADSVTPALLLDDEPCNEPPFESERCALTPTELRVLDIAKQKAKQRAKAKATGANMFQHAKASATA
ncbi:hypothetical protein [Burkholderia sp. S171]|uniref:hypothetical protein n=1 Tax=Burkholderia sp. S171 TaxID=1641860 RepID=UPI00131B3676|nr:hypothetical protein [Burkholderia sp. S171]